MKDTKGSQRIWVWVGVAVLVIAVIVWVIWKPGAQPPTQQTANANPAPVYAPQGQLVPQFPKTLILDSAAVLTGSYSISYSSSANQYTAEYNSSSSMASLYNAYKQYLPANGWTITNDVTQYANSRAISASNASSSVALVVARQGNGSQVTISYVAK